jgi:transposase
VTFIQAGADLTARLEGRTAMLMLADPVDFVIGVDTHKDTHTAAIVDGRTGAQQTQLTVSADAAGYHLLLGWATRCCPGTRMWAVEGTGSYGAGLTVALTSAAEQVREVDRVRRPRRGDKNDVIDAARAAAEALLRELPKPRSAGHRNALRMVLSCRKSAVGMRTATINELKSMIVTVPEHIRGQLRGLRGAALHDAIAGLPLPWDIADIEDRYSGYALQQLAIRINLLDV